MAETNSNQDSTVSQDLDTYGQLALKTIVTVSMGSCAFTLAAIGALFSALHEKNPDLALKVIAIADKPFDLFLKAAISSILAIGTIYTAYIALSVEEDHPNNKCASCVSFIFSLSGIICGYAALVFCVLGFLQMLSGIENIVTILGQRK